jgi:hypothetical protein
VPLGGLHSTRETSVPHSGPNREHPMILQHPRHFLTNLRQLRILKRCTSLWMHGLGSIPHLWQSYQPKLCNSTATHPKRLSCCILWYSRGKRRPSHAAKCLCVFVRVCVMLLFLCALTCEAHNTYKYVPFNTTPFTVLTAMGMVRTRPFQLGIPAAYTVKPLLIRLNTIIIIINNKIIKINKYG